MKSFQTWVLLACFSILLFSASPFGITRIYVNDLGDIQADGQLETISLPWKTDDQMEALGYPIYDFSGGVGYVTDLNGGVNIMSPSSTTARLVFGTEVDNEAFMFAARHGNSQMRFQAGSFNPITLTKTGRIGLFDTSPSFDLDMTGDARFTGNVTVAAPTANGHAVRLQDLDGRIDSSVDIQAGNALPEGTVTADPGVIYVSVVAGVATLWMKGTGTGNTGWVEK